MNFRPLLNLAPFDSIDSTCKICKKNIHTYAKIILYCECQFHIECFLENKNNEKCANCNKIIVEKCATDEDFKCAICLEILKNPGTKTLKCKHIFHDQCIRKWQYSDNLNSLKCPLCRKDIHYE